MPRRRRRLPRARRRSRRRASTRSSARSSGSPSGRADLGEWHELTERIARARRRGRDRARRQVREAPRRLPLGARGAQARGHPPRRAGARALGRRREHVATRRPRASSSRSTACSSPAASARAAGRARSSPAASRASAGSRTSASASACTSPSREFARHVVGLEGANSTEMDPETPYPVIDLLPEQKEIEDLGGTMRLGAQAVELAEGTRAREAYGEAVDPRAPPAPLRGQQPLPPAARRRRPRRLRARSRRAGSSRSSSCPTTRGSSPASSTRSSSRGRRGRRRCSATSSAPRSTARPPAGRRRRCALPVVGSARAARARSTLFLELAAIAEPAGRGAGRRRPRARLPARPRARRVDEDDAGAEVGSTIGNLYCRLEPTARRARRSSSARISTRCRRRARSSRSSRTASSATRAGTILGADNKAAVAAMLEGARRVLAESRPHAGIELLFTPKEEVGLLGAAAFDEHAARRAGRATSTTRRARSARSSSARRTQRSLEVRFHGRAAHAGMAPEEGRSAIAAAARAIADLRLGRIDDETTANVGADLRAARRATSSRSGARSTAEARSHDERKLADARPGDARRDRVRRQRSRTARSRRGRARATAATASGATTRRAARRGGARARRRRADLRAHRRRRRRERLQRARARRA